MMKRKLPLRTLTLIHAIGALSGGMPTYLVLRFLVYNSKQDALGMGDGFVIILSALGAAIGFLVAKTAAHMLEASLNEPAPQRWTRKPLWITFGLLGLALAGVLAVLLLRRFLPFLAS